MGIQLSDLFSMVDLGDSSKRMVNLGRSPYSAPTTDYNWRYTPMAASSASVVPERTSPWEGFWDKAQSKASDWLTDPGNIMKLLGGGLGAYASWRSAQQYNKLAEQQRNALAAQKAAQDAARAKYDAPMNYAYDPGKQLNALGGDTGEALYFRPTMQVVRAAEGGQPQQQRTGTLGALGALFGLGLDQRTPEQRKEDAKEEERRRRLSPSERFNEDAASAFQKDIVRTGQPAPKGYMAGGTPGQSDKIPALLSDGEFVMDADTVSALGDGNNAAGASALEQMRQNIRKHKRAAPVNKIPPKAKKPEAYLKKGK